MLCPFCGFENISGVDQCARCEVSLVGFENAEDHSMLELDLLQKPLGDIVAQDYLTVGPDDSIGDVVQRFQRDGVHCALVVEHDRLVGIVTERDVLQKVVSRYHEVAGQPVRDFMTPEPESLQNCDPVAFALNRMMVGDYRHLPILAGHTVQGVVSVRDIMDYLLRRLDEVLPAA